MSTPAHFNYAHFAGIYSVGGAVVFAIIYLPLLVWYILQFLRLRTRIFILLSLFCAVRVASFILRAIMAASESSGENKDLLIAEAVLFGVGISGIMSSAVELIFDRERLFGFTLPGWIPPRLVRLRPVLARACIIAGVALGVSAANMVYSDNPDTAKSGMSYRRTSTYIFLGFVVVLLVNALLSVKSELEMGIRYREGSFGHTHGGFLLVAIAAILLIRMAFYAATTHHLSTQQKEGLWYPFVALPEFVATVIFLPRGLVPPREELKARQQVAEELAKLGRSNDQGFTYPPPRHTPV